jgi:hypothetical protein
MKDYPGKRKTPSFLRSGNLNLYWLCFRYITVEINEVKDWPLKQNLTSLLSNEILRTYQENEFVDRPCNRHRVQTRAPTACKRYL